MSDLLTCASIDDDPREYVHRHGTVVREFDHRTQTSGNVSWLVDTAAGSLFVKTPGRPGPQPPGAPVPALDHSARIALLRNAADLARSCDHLALARLLNVIETPVGPALVYARARGELVGVPPHRRNDPSSAYRQLAQLEAGRLLRIFDALLDLHASLARVGWIAGDLYDGSLIVDFSTGSLTVVDLDHYRRGPGVNEVGRMVGSTRFMAPEEFERGATIDQRTTVYTLGRLLWHFGTRLTEEAVQFCGTPALARVVQQACQPAPSERFARVADLLDAWHRAGGRP